MKHQMSISDYGDKLDIHLKVFIRLPSKMQLVNVDERQIVLKCAVLLNILVEQSYHRYSIISFDPHLNFPLKIQKKHQASPISSPILTMSSKLNMATTVSCPRVLTPWVTS